MGFKKETSEKIDILFLSLNDDAKQILLINDKLSVMESWVKTLTERVSELKQQESQVTTGIDVSEMNTPVTNNQNEKVELMPKFGSKLEESNNSLKISVNGLNRLIKISDVIRSFNNDSSDPILFNFNNFLDGITSGVTFTSSDLEDALKRVKKHRAANYYSDNLDDYTLADMIDEVEYIFNGVRLSDGDWKILKSWIESLRPDHVRDNLDKDYEQAYLAVDSLLNQSCFNIKFVLRAVDRCYGLKGISSILSMYLLAEKTEVGSKGILGNLTADQVNKGWDRLKEAIGGLESKAPESDITPCEVEESQKNYDLITKTIIDTPDNVKKFFTEINLLCIKYDLSIYYDCEYECGFVIEKYNSNNIDHLVEANLKITKP